MNRRNVRGAALGFLAVVLAACGTVGSSAAPSAVGFEESQSAFCSAFGSMLRAVGNPDAGTPSVFSKALDDAVEAGDVAAAERAAASMMSELEAGRQEAARAGQWASAQAAADAMDKLLLAFQAMTTAKLAQAGRAAGAIDPQLAFEQAGGVDAWTAMLTAARDMPLPDGATPVPCKAYSGTP